MHRGIIASAGVVALAALAASLGAATMASGSQKTSAKISGPEKVFVLPTSTTSVKDPGRIVLTGTVADYGAVVKTNAKGKPTVKGSYVNLELKKGTMLVSVTGFDDALTKAFSHATFDQKTCSISVSGVTGPVTVVSGTKAYAGIKGSFAMTGNVAEIGPTVKGACTTKTTTPPVTTFFELTGTGSVSLP